MRALLSKKLFLFNINRHLSSASPRKRLSSTSSAATTTSETHHLSPYTNCVLFSKSDDIYVNLAFEDWLYKNINFSQPESSLLLMWYNRPAVVIGRHQNPWLECRVHSLNEKGVPIARRNSGGGTVYHDLGNLNCSFFTSRKKYNRKTNLEIISRALKKHWNIESQISVREDLVMNDFKISGTASKLGAKNAYHHCTLLVDINKSAVHQALKPQNDNIISKATASVRSKIINLKEVSPEITVRNIINKIALEFQEYHNLPTTGTTVVTPSENLAPGISAIIKDLMSWDWIYGKTPRFIVQRSFPVPTDHLEIDALDVTDLVLELTVYHGIIESVKVDKLPSLNEECVQSLNDCLKGEKFTMEDIDFACSQWLTLNILNEEMTVLKFIIDCVKNTVWSVYR